MIFLSPSKGCNLWDLIDQILIYYTIKQLLGRYTDHFRWINWWLACCSFYRCSDIFCLIHGYSDIFDFSSSIQFDIRPPFYYKKMERIMDVHSPLMHLTAQSRSLNWLYLFRTFSSLIFRLLWTRVKPPKNEFRSVRRMSFFAVGKMYSVVPITTKKILNI